MLPPKKKRKVEGGDEDDDAVMTDAPTAGLDTLDQLLDQFVESLDDLPTASSTLLSVKDFQRTILKQWDHTAATLADKHSQVEKHCATLANLDYEQGHWESKIQHLKSSSKTPQLEALCREELDDNLTSSSKVLEKFLGQDISSVEHQQPKVIQILHQQINARGTLERDLSQRNKEWLNLSNIQKKRAQFLHQLPDKLREMEKASLPLQRFFAAARKTEDSDVSTAKYNTTSDRDTRLQLAHQLAGPLYTLFVQLQAYLDDYPHKNMSLDIGHASSVVVGLNKDTEDTIWKEPSDKVVLWQIPIPQVGATSTGGKPKFLTIAFCYFETIEVVTAKAMGGADDKLDISTVLQLNPKDVGAFCPEEAAFCPDEATLTPYGKPYLWCNYLAGLQILGDRKPVTNSSSTRVIVAEVVRNIQTNATLHYILHKVLPSHPRASALPPTTAASNSNCLAKVSSFQLVPPTEEGTTTCRTYKIVCKRGNHSLPLTVQFDTALYPILAPPVWTLTGNTLQWGKEHGSCQALEGGASAPPLHQPRLAAMEAKVNDIDALVESLKQKQSDDEESKEEAEMDSYYYDWILTHQLREIMVEWEEWVTSDAHNESSGGGAVRTVRGRDRAKVE